MRATLALAVLVLAAGCGTASQATSSGPASTQPTATAPAADLATPEVVTTPQPDDFELEVKVLKKQCFGTAGCNITYRIDPTYTGTGYADDVKWRVIYEVTGVEDGPQINSFTLLGEQIEYTSEESASTSSSSAKLRAKVTEVLKD